MWVRGLKLYRLIGYDSKFESHPMWVRGLKLDILIRKRLKNKSHPMWVRGLKHENQTLYDHH